MKLDKRDLGKALDHPDPGIRFYLFSGPDESQSRAHGDRLLTALGAEKSAVSAAVAKADTALLADEAGAIGLFGGKRAIWVDPAGEEVVDAVEALLAARASESPVIAIAGSLRKNSRLLALAEAHADALSFVSYAPEGQQAEQMVTALARTAGLRVRDDVAARLAAACRNDRAVAAQELAKLASYLDASPQQPRDLDHDSLDAIGADMEETSSGQLADLALAGEGARLAAELTEALPGLEPIPVLRALQRRIMLIAPARARIEKGERPNAAMASMGKALFWKDKQLVADLLGRWDSQGLARVSDRAGRLERTLLTKNPPPGGAALGEELLAIARAAARRR